MAIKLHNKKEPIMPARFYPLATVKTVRQKDGSFVDFKVVELIIEYPANLVYDRPWKARYLRWAVKDKTNASKIILTKDNISTFPKGVLFL